MIRLLRLCRALTLDQSSDPSTQSGGPQPPPTITPEDPLYYSDYRHYTHMHIYKNTRKSK